MENVLEIRGISKNFGGVQALHECSFKVRKGIITSIIGPNGAGKTTVFNVITGFVSPDEGSIELIGREITGGKPHKIAMTGISRTFQIPRVFDHLSIEENMMLALKQKGENPLTSFFYGRKANDSERQKIKKVLYEIGLDKNIQILASDLSYGQKRLLEIARALLKDHEILLLDEPTAGVNPKLRQELKKILKKLRKEGKTILIIEHDMEFVMDLSDEIIVMEAGKHLMTGKPDKVRKDKRVLEAYLGK